MGLDYQSPNLATFQAPRVLASRQVHLYVDAFPGPCNFAAGVDDGLANCTLIEHGQLDGHLRVRVRTLVPCCFKRTDRRPACSKSVDHIPINERTAHLGIHHAEFRGVREWPGCKGMLWLVSRQPCPRSVAKVFEDTVQPVDGDHA